MIIWVVPSGTKDRLNIFVQIPLFVPSLAMVQQSNKQNYGDAVEKPNKGWEHTETRKSFQRLTRSLAAISQDIYVNCVSLPILVCFLLLS